MLFIGIDPGTAITGYGLLEERPDGSVRVVDYGVLRTPAGMQQAERLLSLHHALLDLLLLHKPEQAAVEKLFFQKNVKTALTVGEARGVAMLTLAMQGVKIAEYTPSEIKQSVVGYGVAEKRQIQFMVTELLRLDSLPQPDDAADALAIAICHMQHYKYNHMVESL